MKRTTRTSCERLILVALALTIAIFLSAYARTTEEDPPDPPTWSMQP